jgi:hypothetical protein
VFYVRLLAAEVQGRRIEFFDERIEESWKRWGASPHYLKEAHTETAIGVFTSRDHAEKAVTG